MVNTVGTPGNDDISGTDGDDDLRGLDGNDIIRDALGVNYIDGGLGADTFVFKANTVAGVHVDLSLSGYQDVGGAQFSFNNIEGVYGTGYGDTLVGSSANESLGGAYGDDVLRGMGGNDILHGDYGHDIVYGGDGDDTLYDDDGGEMYGDDGNDTFTVSQLTRVVYRTDGFLIDGGDGDDTVNYFATSQNVLTLIGGAGADTLVLSQGRGTVDAGSGDDHITAGGSYFYLSQAESSANFTITLGAGQDTLKINTVDLTYGGLSVTDFSVTTDPDSLDLTYYTSGQFYDQRDWAGLNPSTPYSFANGLLRLVQDGADTLIQAADFFYTWPAAEWSKATSWSTIVTLDNVAASALTSSHLGVAPAGPVWTQGSAGDDTTDGTAGADYLMGGDGNDLIRGLGGADSLEGGAGNDRLEGGLGNDTLRGGAGNDVLQGDAGSDTLVSGFGAATTFLFNSTNDSHLFSADFIIDFQASGGDLVDVSAIDANTTVAGDQAFYWALSLTGHAGELVAYYNSTRDVSQVQGDVDGDGLPDFVLEFAQNHVGDTGYFIL
jgi:Ca2+-binding RTX toxin-like protein